MAGRRGAHPTPTKLYRGANEVTKLYYGAYLFREPTAVAPPGPPFAVPDSAKNILVGDTPTGMWGSGNTMWVGFPFDDLAFAFDLTTLMIDTSSTIDSGLSFPEGLMGHGPTIWVRDDSNILKAFNVSDQVRNGTLDLTLVPVGTGTAIGNTCTDGTTVWAAISGGGNTLLAAYSLATGDRDPDKDITTVQTNTGSAPPHITYYDGTIFISGRHHVYAYTTETKLRNVAFEFAHPDFAGDGGIWTNGTTMWIADDREFTIFAFTLMFPMVPEPEPVLDTFQQLAALDSSMVLEITPGGPSGNDPVRFELSPAFGTLHRTHPADMFTNTGVQGIERFRIRPTGNVIDLHRGSTGDPWSTFMPANIDPDGMFIIVDIEAETYIIFASEPRGATGSGFMNYRPGIGTFWLTRWPVMMKTTRL